MRSPITNKEMIVQKEKSTLTFRKEEFEIIYHYYLCEDTGEQFEDEQFTALNYNQVVNQYRDKYKIPFPEQISKIRRKYKVPASKMSNILGFGTNSYRNYENGEVPNLSNAKLIQISKEPEEFRTLVNICSKIENKEILKINKRIDELIELNTKNQAEIQFEKYLFGKHLPSSITGYKTPNFNKFAQMVIFFSEKLQPWKTKLNKLLFYADFEMFKNTGFSISGVQYRAIDLGPVPEKFQSIFEYMENKQMIKIKSKSFDDNGTGEQFFSTPENTFKPELFTDKEKNVLNNIVEKFNKIPTKKIVDLSHQEKAWIENEKKRNLIDYQYSFDLIN